MRERTDAGIIRPSTMFRQSAAAMDYNRSSFLVALVFRFMPVAPSSSAAPLRLEPRADLAVRRKHARGQELVLVADPLAGRQWFWRPEEWFVWESLSAETTRDRLRQRWERRFAPRRLAAEALQGILTRLLRAGMIRPLDGEPLEALERCATAERAARGPWWSRVLALRGPGLALGARQLRWRAWAAPLFSRSAAAAYVGLLAYAGWVAVQRVSQLRAESAAAALPQSLAGVALWLVTLAVVKAWHEFGHLAAAIARGVRVRRIESLLLCGVPTLSCVIDDAWRAARKARLLVDAGGMLFESALAAGALLAWAATIPGPTHDLALRIALLGAVNTLFLNGNPLLRYDGYYLLSDATGIPNLAAQANTLTTRAVDAWLGFNDPRANEPPLQRHAAGTRGWLIAYSIASVTYRWALAWGMVWYVRSALRPYGWTSPATILGAAFIVLFAMPPLRSLRNLWRRRATFDEAGRRRAFVRLSLLAALVMTICFIPWPCSVELPILWRAPGAVTLTATTPGRLVRAAPVGSSVVRDQIIVELEDPEFAQRLARAEGTQRRAEEHLTNLRRRHNDDRATAEAPAAAAALRDATARAEELRRQGERLTLRAPRAGVLLAPRTRPTRTAPLTEAGEPPLASPTDASWDGRPDEPRNVGAWIETGTDLGLIADPARREAWALVEQFDIDALAPGQPVELRAQADPGARRRGVILEISAIPATAIGPEWAALDPAQHRPHAATDDDERKRAGVDPRTTSYLVRLSCDDALDAPPWDAGGTARISVAPQSPAARGLRWFTRTFGWHW